MSELELLYFKRILAALFTCSNDTTIGQIRVTFEEAAITPQADNRGGE